MWKLALFLFLTVYANPKVMKDPLVFDFGEGKDAGRWTIVNDGVMGGLSQSQVQLDANTLLFSGIVSLQNNGGFVSLRSALGKYDLSSYEYCEIRFKSNNDRKFEILIEKETPFYLPKYRAKFGGNSDEWETIRIPLRDFELSRMGSTMQEGIDAKSLECIQRIGFILADKQKGSFRIWIDYLKFY